MFELTAGLKGCMAMYGDVRSCSGMHIDVDAQRCTGCIEDVRRVSYSIRLNITVVNSNFVYPLFAGLARRPMP